MSIAAEPEQTEEQAARLSLSTAAARNLATTTKSAPQMQGISSRWLLRMLPWVQADGGTYRVNRRLAYAVGRGRVAFVREGAAMRVVPPTLAELPALRGVDDEDLLAELASRCTQREFARGDVLVEAGAAVDAILLVGRGKVDRIRPGKYDHDSALGPLAEGDHLGDEALTDPDATWAFGARAATAGTVLALPAAAVRELAERSPELAAALERFRADTGQPANHQGEADIAVASGHDGEPDLPGTFADYELAPREYELSVAQTVLRVHSRVADLYNSPMNQVEQQLKLTIEALRERQEHEMVNNPDFGLLHNADPGQRIQTHAGPPAPDDFDELLAMRRDTKLLLAHPRTIAAFGRECNRRGVYPDHVDVAGTRVTAWRGVPLFPCDKIPIADGHTSSVLAMRTGADDQGVVGLHQIGIPDEYEPGLNVRFMGINRKAVVSYLVSTYFSAAVLVPDALGILENAEIARPRG
ncbi:family 2B encapsulin nanocompartment shell protein [Yinghuangia sp. YIM S09857]|uniref:family 2B encapsulin nanocompartment shell protein n=1 Tax=Yinghuangia sp. YIM S09857 TaxID=3436929 RepID=UPI003F52FB18